MGIENIGLVVYGNDPHVAENVGTDEAYTIGRQQIATVGGIAEGGECIAVVVGEPVPCAKPHQSVRSLLEIGNGVGGKAVENGEFAHVTVRLCP